MATTIITDGERDVLSEQNRDAYQDFKAEWKALTDEEREEALEDTKREIDEANREASLQWAVEAEMAAECKHGLACTRTICRVLTGIEADKAAGTYQPAPVRTLNDNTFPAHMRSRHNLMGRYA